MKVEEKSEKADLKLNIQKAKIMTSGPITSWQINGETTKTQFFFGSKTTAIMTLIGPLHFTFKDVWL